MKKVILKNVKRRRNETEMSRKMYVNIEKMKFCISENRKSREFQRKMHRNNEIFGIENLKVVWLKAVSNAKNRGREK